MDDGEPRRRRRALGVRTLLLFVALVPTAGMVILAVQSSASAAATREAATRVRDHAEVLSEILEVRLPVSAEEVHSSVRAFVAEAEVDREALKELLATRHKTAMDASRAALDEAMARSSLTELAGLHERLKALRRDIDRGAAGYAEVRDVFTPLRTNLDIIWSRRLDALEGELGSERFTGVVRERVESVRATQEALVLDAERNRLMTEMFSGERRPDTLDLLVDASSNYRYLVKNFRSRLGPTATQAWIAHDRDASRRQLEQTMLSVIDDFVADPQSPAVMLDLPAEVFLQSFGEAAEDSTGSLAGLSSVVDAATEDLRTEAARQADAASEALRNQLAFAAVLLTVAVSSALFVGGILTRPIRRLEQVAKQVHDGVFDLEPLRPTGPRELVDSATAFNEMASTLATVEAQAVAMAVDPDAPVLTQTIPGRTGRSLQMAMNRLRASIQDGERQRADLEHAATHDELTGLLNRAAALPMIEHRLSQADRDRQRVMTLFIDLDGLKTINDEYGGHEVGDAAVRLMAGVLRECTRDADMVARLGGDEFLVAGTVDTADDVEEAAERIRRAVAARQLLTPTGATTLRCSIGMAMSDPGTTVDDLVRRADRGLYLAKQSGKNRARWAEQPHAPTGDVTATPASS